MSIKRRVRWMAPVGVLAVVLSSTIGYSVANAVDPTVQTLLELSKTGSEPYDDSSYNPGDNSNAGKDSSASDNIVRLGDTVTYQATAVVNDSPAPFAITEFTMDGNGRWVSIPSGCSIDASPVKSEIKDLVNPGDARLLMCVMPNMIEGQAAAVAPVARANRVNSETGKAVLNGSSISASMSSHAADANGNPVSEKSTSGPVEALITADFGVNLSQVMPKASGTGTNNASGTKYGRFITYVVTANYKNGSMIADSNETDFLQTYSLRHFITDDKTANDTAGLSTNAIPYTWGPKPFCQILGNSGASASVTCKPAAPYDATGPTSSNSLSEKDGVLDPSVDVTLNNIDVRDPDNDGNLYKVQLTYWVPDSDFVNADGTACSTVCTNFMIGEVGEPKADGGYQSLTTVSTEDSVGVNHQNYEGAGEPVADTRSSQSLTRSGPGLLNLFMYNNAQTGSTLKPIVDTASPGETFVLGASIADNRDYLPSTMDKVCIKFDNTQYEAIGPASLTTVNNSFSKYGLPTNRPWAGSPRMVYADNGSNIPSVSNYYNDTEAAQIGIQSTVKYGYLPMVDSASLKSSSCGDANIVWSNTPVSSGPTATNILYYDIILDHAKLDAASGRQNNRFQSAFNWEMRVRTTATGYGPEKYMPSFFGYSYNKTESLTNDFSDWTENKAVVIATDPNDAGYSYNGNHADRIKLVNSSITVAKKTNPSGVKVVKPNDVVEFDITPYASGAWADSSGTIHMEDTLPKYTSLVDGSVLISPDNGKTWMAPADYSASKPAVAVDISSDSSKIVADYSDMQSSEIIPIIRYKVQVAPTAPAVSFVNKVTVDSPINPDSNADGKPDQVQAVYEIFTPALSGLSVLKTTSESIDPVNGEGKFNLVYNNLGGTDYSTGTFIDVLPYNGDASYAGGLKSERTPGSSFSGTRTLTSLSGSNSEKFWATNTPSAEVNMDICSSSNQPAGYVPVAGDPCYTYYTTSGNTLPDGKSAGTGSTTWTECTSTNPVTCGSLDPSKITAIKFTTGPIKKAGGGHTVTMTLKMQDNVKGDVYTNNFGGRVPEIAFSLISNDVTYNVTSGSIGDYVWLDDNADGVQDATEKGVSNVVVSILIEDPATPGTYAPYLFNGKPLTATTDANGKYMFENLPPGKFRVVVTPSGSILNAVQTFDPDTVFDNTGTSVLTFDGKTVNTDLTRDFGYDPTPGSVGDTVWYDVNGDGVQDATEKGIAGVKVTVSYVDYEGKTVTTTAVTDADGKYLVKDMPLNAEITVSVDTSTLPKGVMQTFDADGGLNNQSKVTLTFDKTVNLDQDFGYDPTPASIGDTVWYDLNNDGKMDAGEELAGVKVTVSVTDVNGKVTSVEAITDAAGKYLVSNLPFGSAVVTVDPTTLPKYAVPAFDFDGGSDLTSKTVLSPTNVSDLNQDFSVVPPAPSIVLVKSISKVADTSGDGLTNTGDTITYKFVVTNTGNVPLTNVTLDDKALKIVGAPCVSSLEVGKTATCSTEGSHVITVEDMAKGGVENTATTGGTAPDGKIVTDTSDAGTNPEYVKPNTGPSVVTNESSTETPNPLKVYPNTDQPGDDPTTLLLKKSQPSILLRKSVTKVNDVNNNGFTDSGDTVEYKFEVTNSGPVPLVNVTVTDSTVGLNGKPCVSKLAIGETAVCDIKVSYPLTDKDWAKGGVENTAVTNAVSVDGDKVSDISDTGTKPDRTVVSDNEKSETPNPLKVYPNTDQPGDDPTTVLTGEIKPQIVLVKSIDSVEDTNKTGYTDTGDTVTYKFAVTNTGNVALKDVTVTDAKLGMTNVPCVANLAINESAQCASKQKYVITESDVKDGGVENTATTTGTDVISGKKVTDTSDTGTDVNGAPVVTPEKVETANPLKKYPNTDQPGDDPTTLLIKKPTPAPVPVPMPIPAPVVTTIVKFVTSGSGLMLGFIGLGVAVLGAVVLGYKKKASKSKQV